MTMMILLAALTADFNEAVGTVRPELHSSGFGPTICSQSAQDLADVKAMGFKYARTHDWALINPNQRVCDYFHIFPLMRLDAKDPENYVFGPTDYLLKRTREEAGLDVYYRLGTSIEHSGPKVHFNSLIPSDFDKVAEIFAGTVRHYNRGWANGFNWGIKYWAIWTEPDGTNNMWCLPDGDGPDDGGVEWKEKYVLRRAKFVKFFVMALKRLKDEFGDSIKVGGPALCWCDTDYFKALLVGCKEAGVAPDFISWHGYACDPLRFNREAEEARALCDSLGFPKCELIVDEWHYFGENYTWHDLRSSDSAVRARVWDGPNGHNGIRSACFTLATLANLQRSKLDQAYFYGCRHTGAWGFKDEQQRKFKVFHALKAFGEMLKAYPTICASRSEGSVTVFAARNAAGGKALLAVDYGGSVRRIDVDIAGIDASAKPTCRVLDHLHDLTEHAVSFKDGKLTLVKPDFDSASFVVSFP